MPLLDFLRKKRTVPRAPAAAKGVPGVRKPPEELLGGGMARQAGKAIKRRKRRMKGLLEQI